MKYENNKVSGVKIAYVGGGSRGWAWKLMSDLAAIDDVSGHVDLYDIDYEAAQHNEIIGNKFGSAPGAKSEWTYTAKKTIEEALEGANFVIISILPGTFDEMESDVHAPEKYGIYQSVGDTTGPGGIIRALRTIPMMEVIAKAVEKCAPNAWVINFTNPMALCVKALYDAFPKIKAFGCCHEVFGTQNFIARILRENHGIAVSDRSDIKTNVVGVNHFTWVTSATYRDIDIFPIYKEFAEKNKDCGVPLRHPESYFEYKEKVKMDLFLRYGAIAAAGDRHLAEFCPGTWYLDNPEQVDNWGFKLTPVSWRKVDLKDRLEKSRRLRSGEEEVRIEKSGEEGADLIRALLGLCNIVTNVNLPNAGQIPNLPLGAVVETNASFRDNSVVPVLAGNVPEGVYHLVAGSVDEQLTVARAAKERDLELAFKAFCKDPLVVKLDTKTSRKLFDEMIENTKEYLTEYFK